MNAEIVVEGLRVNGVIGVDSWERGVRQELLVDLRLQVDISDAIRTDSVHDALDYGAVSSMIQQTVSRSRFRLIEGLAAHLLAEVMRTFAPKACQLTLHKTGAVPDARDIHITVCA